MELPRAMHQAGVMKTPAGLKQRNKREEHWGGKAGEQDLILETWKVWLDLIGSVGNSRTLSRI